MQFAAIFAILVGVGMIAQWLMSYISGQIPELKREPVRLAFHLAAEFTTAMVLIASGIGILAGQAWGRRLYLVAAGMLFYTAIVSPGYFAQQGKWGWLVMFAAIIMLGLYGVALVW